MSIKLDISKGIKPVPVNRDIRNDEYYIRAQGKSYVFRTLLPFTTILMRRNNVPVSCVDEDLVIKHADKAVLIKDLSGIEDLTIFRSKLKKDG